MIRPYYNLSEPSYSQRPAMRIGGGFTAAVKWIFLICIGVFLLQTILKNQPGGAYRAFEDTFAFVPMGRLGTYYLWQYVTYMALHADFWHIFFNLFFFYMVGGIVERRLGTRRFTYLFLVCGIAGAIAQGLIFPDSRTIGASAGVMGAAAACALLYPDMVVLVLFIIPMKMKHFLLILVAFEIFGASRGGNGIAYFAHLAGLAAAWLYIRYELRVAAFFSNLYYGSKGRFRGFTGGPKSTHIEDDTTYRTEVDRLLDKIFKQGTQSLTQEENEFLKKQSERFRK